MLTSTDLTTFMPFARRYARALTGSQHAGDALVVQAVHGQVAELPGRLALYADITRLAGARPDVPAGGRLWPVQRQLVLLTSLEAMSLADAARIVGLDETEAREQLHEAHAALRAAVATDVLIIEDEPVLAMELQMLLQGCGHRVMGVAASEDEAVRLARADPTGLVVADIMLGTGGNGIVAVRRILATLDVPVIFVTGYPEQLLTAVGIEPAFVIAKPFEPLTLSICAYQAVTSGHVPLH